MKNLRVLLKAEFNKRRRHNPRYSLRAFAASLRISDSSLSKIMRSLRNPSNGTLLKMGKNLKWTQESIESSGKLLRRLRMRKKKKIEKRGV